MPHECTRRQLLRNATALGGLVAGGMGRPVQAATRNGRLAFAAIGMGGQMMNYLVKELEKLDQDIVAVCDVDRGRLAVAADQERLATARAYTDYRELLAKEKDVDAVVIGTPDHWHVPIALAALEADRHVYCEKPLAHSVAECHALAEAARRRPHLAAQTGNQGCSTEGFRRSMEVLRSGLLGTITDVHVWHPAHGWPSGVDRPDGADPVPDGLDWAFWLGPAASRPFKSGIYHPGEWRGWYDFGGGSLADFCCHGFQLVFRALDLGPPQRVEVEAEGLGRETFPTRCTVTYHFAAQGDRGPVRLVFRSGDGNVPPDDITLGPASRTGCIIVGTAGSLSAGLWNTDCRVRLGAAREFGGAEQPEVARIPTSEPRIDAEDLVWRGKKAAGGDRPRWGAVNNSHMFEWVRACAGEGRTYSPFEIGTAITEVGMIGLLALRLGRAIEWDSAARRVVGLPEADRLIDPAPATRAFFPSA
ncbi:MAG: Gfo/Idh/MocA family protein [Planctomycetaceae bacterium]